MGLSPRVLLGDGAAVGHHMVAEGSAFFSVLLFGFAGSDTFGAALFAGFAALLATEFARGYGALLVFFSIGGRFGFSRHHTRTFGLAYGTRYGYSHIPAFELSLFLVKRLCVGERKRQSYESERQDVFRHCV